MIKSKWRKVVIKFRNKGKRRKPQSLTRVGVDTANQVNKPVFQHVFLKKYPYPLIHAIGFIVLKDARCTSLSFIWVFEVFSPFYGFIFKFLSLPPVATVFCCGCCFFWFVFNNLDLLVFLSLFFFVFFNVWVQSPFYIV